MSAPRIGGLFFGYGGLDMAARDVFGGELAWVSEIDKAACKLIEHRHPGVPNLGDITQVDWSQVEPVDILTGGSPCQDLSHAGRRAGMTEGTRSNLWVAMREAIAVLKPRLVIWENVRGANSAPADSEVEPCAGCVGDGSGVHLRALGRVLGDLSSLGYDAQWHGLRAADIGFCHGRFRYFVAAYPQGDSWWIFNGDGRAVADTGSIGRDGRRLRSVEKEGSGSLGSTDRRGYLPTPTTRDHKGRNQRDDATCLTGALLPSPRATDGTKGGPSQRGSSGDLMLPSAVTLLPTPSVSDGTGGHANRSGDRSGELLLPGVAKSLALLPTPAVNDMGEGKTVDAWDEWTDAMQAKHGNGNGHGKSLSIEAQRLLPTPRVTQPGYADDGRGGRSLDVESRTPERWGEYAQAIHRQELITGRTAPEPTQLSSKGNPQLSAAFSEWMMGLPAGHITDVPGLSRNDMLKLCGNGVIPQQAAFALRLMVARAAVIAA